MQTETHIEAPIRYLVEREERIVNYVYEPPPGVPRKSGTYDFFAMKIENGRKIVDTPTLDQHGFQLGEHETKVKDFYDREEVKAVHYPEVEQLLKDVLGVEKVVVFDHNVRCTPKKKKGDRSISGTTRFAHNDYTLRSGPRRVRDLLDADEAEERLKHPFMQINVWRPIERAIQESPLAVCDAQSMELEDFRETDLKFPGRTGEIYTVAHNPNHRWIYFPQMKPPEVLFLKGYDSRDDGRARFPAHTGFDDPTSPPNAPARESVEARTFVFYAPEG